MIVGHIGGGSVGTYTGDIGHSIRFRGAQSITRTITTDATSTYFAAIKRGKLGVITPIFDTKIKFNANDTITAFGLTTTAVFRDPTSWLFIHVSNGGLYVNGVSYGAVTTSSITNPRIGYDGTNYADMCVARIGVVGGSSSSYTNFGYLNSETNAWVTKTQSEVKAVVDAGGANSFMLEFNNATSLTTLGQDNSSKGNNWTLNNFSLTAGTTYDHMLDVPGNSYATLNPLNSSIVGTAYSTLSDGNLRINSYGAANAYSGYYASMSAGIPLYCELSPIVNNAAVTLGIVKSGHNPAANYLTPNVFAACFPASTSLYVNNVASQTGLPAITAGTSTIGMTFDPVTREVKFYKNGSQIGTTITATAGDYTVSCYAQSSAGAGGSSADLNFGQRPFSYTPPTGFKALCQANLPGGETIETSGTFTGTLAADGPYRDVKGVPLTMTINGNAVTWGAHADKTAFGFKLRTASSSYNNTGSNTFSITSTGAKRKYSTGQGNP